MIPIRGEVSWLSSQSGRLLLGTGTAGVSKHTGAQACTSPEVSCIGSQRCAHGRLQDDLRANSEVAMFEIRFPCAALRPFIECYWFLNTTVHSSHSLEEHIFTDARADVVFTFSSPYVRTRADQPGITQRIKSSHVDAQRRYPVRIHREGRAGLIWIRFRFGGLAAFVRRARPRALRAYHQPRRCFRPLRCRVGRAPLRPRRRAGCAGGLARRLLLSRISVPPGIAR